MTPTQDNGIERTRVGHVKLDADEIDVYAGRGHGGKAMGEVPIGERGWLGNPFTVEDHGREESIERFTRKFENRLILHDDFREAVADLSGSVLGCWCQRLDEDEPACHAEIIADWADRIARSRDTDTTQEANDGA